MVHCPICDREFSTKNALSGHQWRHTERGKNFAPIPKGSGHVAWNRGLNKDDPRIARSAQKYSESQKGRKGKPLTDDHRALLSAKMKAAHAEGRAWNIGMSRWNNEPSYPETFFMRVIDNEFTDKGYVREMPFGRFSLDFAWPHKALAIEIDGDQHERFEAQRERDRRKDELARGKGWRVLRIRWRDMYAEPKKWIDMARSFVDN